VASVLSKKIAAGSTHVLIDMPVGPTAKVRSEASADRLAVRLHGTAAALGLQVGVHRSDGTQPVGIGIGPALEARDVLRVLRDAPDAPSDLRERAIAIAGALLDLVPGATSGSGAARARAALRSGDALAKFLAICDAQGGFREPPRAPFTAEVASSLGGRITTIDNRRLARIAKLAGAPASPAAGLETALRIGDVVERGQALFTVHAQSRGELAYALEHATRAMPFAISAEAA
jgi:thymidine phosphorylase